jgi:hypothetical protein
MLLAMGVLEVAERCAFAEVAPRTFVAFFRGACRTSDIVLMRGHLTTFLRGSPTEGYRVLVVMAEGSTLGQRGRSEIGVMLRRASGHVARWANEVEGVGFWASAVRLITLTVTSVARHTFPLRTFESVEAAASWIEEGPPVAEVVAAVANLRAKVPAAR